MCGAQLSGREGGRPSGLRRLPKIPSEVMKRSFEVPRENFGGKVNTQEVRTEPVETTQWPVPPTVT